MVTQQMEKMKKVCVAIINWNGLEWLKKTIPIIEKYSKEANIVVIDNNSIDGSKHYLKTNYKKIKVISHEKNYGFAGGYNRAIKKIKNPYILLINNDVIVTKNWIRPLLKFLELNKEFSVVQPKILNLNKKNYFEYSGAAGGFIDYFGIPFCRGRIGDVIEKDLGQYNCPSKIFWASGTCVLIDRKIFIKVGGFDKQFFMHQEEIDLCWRIQGIGKGIGYCPNSKVFHHGGGTLTTNNYKKTFYNHRNNLIMLFKNLPIIDLILVLVNRILIDFLISISYLFKLNLLSFLATYIAYLSFLILIPKYIFINNKKSEIRRGIQKKVYGKYNTSIILLKVLKFDKFSKIFKFY